MMLSSKNKIFFTDLVRWLEIAIARFVVRKIKRNKIVLEIPQSKHVN